MVTTFEKAPSEFRENEAISKELNNKYPPSPQMLNEVSIFLDKATKKEVGELVKGLNESIKEQCHRAIFFVEYLKKHPRMMTYSTSFMEAFSTQAKKFAPFMKKILKGETTALGLSTEEWGALYEFWKHNLISSGVKHPTREQVLEYIERLGDTNDMLYQKATQPIFRPQKA